MLRGLLKAEKKRPQLEIRKLWKKKLTGKEKHILRVVDHTPIKQVEKLKDKSSKITYIYNR